MTCLLLLMRSNKKRRLSSICTTNHQVAGGAQQKKTNKLAPVHSFASDTQKSTSKSKSDYAAHDRLLMSPLHNGDDLIQQQESSILSPICFLSQSNRLIIHKWFRFIIGSMCWNGGLITSLSTEAITEFVRSKMCQYWLQTERLQEVTKKIIQVFSVAIAIFYLLTFEHHIVISCCN